jgi:ABC-type sugar transport system permease subunit
MEGATTWEIFWKITFPSIGSVLLVIAVYTIIDSFTAYDNATMEMVRVTAFGQSQYGQSAAMAWVYFMMIVAIVAILFAFTSRRIHYRE